MGEKLLAKHGAAALLAQRDAVANLTAATDPPLPPYVSNYLVRARLGHDVPFSYLVPDQALLPKESIRFFTVDESWSDALMEGILAVGSASTRDTEHVEALLPAVRTAVRRAVPLAAGLRRGGGSRQQIAQHVATSMQATTAGGATNSGGDLGDLPGPPPVTGLLLRSAIVSDYPGFSIVAFTNTSIPPNADPSTIPADEIVPILRMELLAPSVLLVLFAGTPALVWIEEPHHGIQLGIDIVDGQDQVTPVASDGTTIVPPADPVVVPTRPGPVPEVIDVASLASALGVTSSAALATQLLRPPYRIRFSADVQEGAP